MNFCFRNRLTAFIVRFVLVISIIHIITYTLDNAMIQKDNEPKFCINTGVLFDGGTKFYYGLGYQIIKWNSMSRQEHYGKYIYGVNHGFEIHRFPFYVDWKKGPTIQLEFRPDIKK